MQASPFLRQLLVALSPQLAAFSMGGAVSYPSVLIDHYKSNESSVQMDVDTMSWIGSMYGLSGIPVIVMPIITQMTGRKTGYIITCLYVIIGWILTYNAETSAEILLSEFFHGLGVNSLLPISFLSMSEMLAPRYRLFAMQTFGIALSLGMATGGIVGRFFHFKVVCIIMLVPVVLAVIIALIWPESPFWFACKGEFDKCTQAFVLLRGTDELSAKELSNLIAAQKENLKRKTTKKMTITTLWNKITSRDFYIPIFYTLILLNMLYWSGSDVVLIYFMDMASKATNNEDASFYAAIVMYVIMVIGMVLINVLNAKFKNKTVLLTSTCAFAFFLICACVITGLQALGLLSESSLLCVYCLLLCMAASSLGLCSLVFVISAELMPVKHRSIGGALYIVINCLLYASSQKLAPYLFLYIDLWGSFLLYAINACLCALFVWKYVPETKGRSLQEIEDFYMYGRFIERQSSDEAVSSLYIYNS